MTFLGAICTAVLLAQAPLRAGDPAPVVEVVGLDGRRLSLEPSGRVTIVDFFATWCPHCRDSLAAHQEILAAHGDRVRIIVVDVEESAPVVRSFFARHPLPEGVVLARDPRGTVMRSFGPKTFPSLYVIDQDGIVRNRLRGWGAGSTQTVIRWVDALVNPPKNGVAMPVVQPARTRGPKTGQPAQTREVSPDERARRMGVEIVR